MNWRDPHNPETGASIALSVPGVQSMASPAKRKAITETGEESRSKKTKDEDAQVQDIDNDKPSPKDGVSSPKELKNALYARCASEDDGKVFFQGDLLSYNIVPDNNVEKLLLYTQQLLNEGLFKLMTKDGKTCWRVVRRDDAAKYKSLTSEEALVYSYIESSGRDGIWSKILRARTNLHMATMNRAVRSLETRNYIKSIKTVRFPTRKTYILSKLQPSEDVTGGPFYTDGALDAVFIQALSTWAERYIIGRSWWHPPPPEHSSKRKPALKSDKAKSHSKPDREEVERLRAEAMQRREKGKERSKIMLPMPPDYEGYPTITEITRAINESKLTDVVMKNAEMQQLVDILCWDGRLERIKSGKAYRAMRVVDEEKNGLTEAPCGTCPVFEICQDDGPVNARTCQYFQDWLQF